MSAGKKANVKYDHLIKLLLIGDSGVGKSCVLLRYSDDAFTPSFITTIGIDFKIKSLNVNGKKIKLQIWDTAGQERFRTITTAYYRGAMGILLVYDATDERSFNNVASWMRQIDQHAPESVVSVLLGNKCDMHDERRVDKERGQALAADYGIQFFETSAKENINIDEAFLNISTQILCKLEDENVDAAKLDEKRVNVSKQAGGGKGGCCK